VQNHDEAKIRTINSVIDFLTLFLCITIAKRVICVILIVADVPCKRIAELANLSMRTVYQIKRDISSGLTPNFKIAKGGGRKPQFLGVQHAILDEINTGIYHSYQQIVDMIKNLFNITTSLSAVAQFLKKHGIKRLKCGSFPAKAEPAKQRAFYQDTLEPLFKLATIKEVTLLFMDASHFVMGCDFLGYIYGRVRQFIQTSSGRQRYNVLGALNFITKKVTTITNDSYITATQVCMLLSKIAKEYAGKPIYIVLDNARYQKCKVVQTLASQLGINLVFIPPYSPNLNLIERFWKYVKSKLRTQYYEKFPLFCDTIDSIVNCEDINTKKALDSLITDKIQFFDDLMHINGPIFASKEGQKNVC
jgi:transposase